LCTGRWSKVLADRVGALNCIEPSSAIDVARQNLSSLSNVKFYQAHIDDDVLPEASQDFGVVLGVLHHLPDPLAGVKSCVRMLKPGAPLLVYIYYALDDRPWVYGLAWKLTNLLRSIISRFPSRAKKVCTDLIALVIYYPLARFCYLCEKFHLDSSGVPLHYYRTHSLYTMRTDSRDRFGTPLEHRLTRAEIDSLLRTAGLGEIRFSDDPPYWCAVGLKQ